MPEPRQSDAEGDPSGAVFRALREEEREACLQLWCTVWPGENSPAYFRRYFYGDVEWLPYYTQVAEVEGRLVSAVQICKRRVGCGPFTLTMGGIANVSTLPEFRGKGYNTGCLKRAIAVMEADAMDFSLLFTGINAYYARQGYADLPRRRMQGTVKPDFTPRPSPYTVRAAEARDLPAVRTIYDHYNRHRPIAVQRSEAYWRDWVRIDPEHPPENLLVAVAGDGEIMGYVRTGVFSSAVPYSAEEVQTRLIEFGSRGATPEAERALAEALLDAVTDRMPPAQTRVLRLEIALEPAVLNVLAGILQQKEESLAASGMVRLLHRDNLLRSMTMVWNERWIAAGRPTGVLTFDTPYGRTRLVAEGAFLRVLPVDSLEYETETAEVLPQSAFFGLLFGTLSPERAMPLGNASGESRTLPVTLHPLLTALFPPQAMVYWGADGF